LFLSRIGPSTLNHEFGGFALDTDRFELRENGAAVSVEPLVFSLLAFLVENRDRVLTKDEIIDHVWRGRTVSDSAINTSINAARRAVGDNGRDQAVIRTYPRRGFRFIAETNEDSEARGRNGDERRPQLPDKPSIAVLPFDNMSGDREQDYFSDGITEDIITALSHIRRLFVIARNSSFALKGKSVDLKQVARDLGVRYVLEGSVRKAGDRIRISVQLIDGLNGSHIWAERYDRELADIFETQDEITTAVAGAIEPEITRVEWARATTKSPESLDAWDRYYKGMEHISRRTLDDYVKARKLFEEAISSSPAFGPAYEGIAITYWFENMTAPSGPDIELGFQAARKAVELDDKDAGAHTTLGRMYTLKGDLEAAIAEHEIAIRLNPSSAASHYNLSRALIITGRGEEAIGHAQSAIRLSPQDPNIGAFYAAMCSACLSLKRNQEAVHWGRKAIRAPVINWPAYAFLTAALAHLGDLEEAGKTLCDLQQRRPDISIGYLRERMPFKSSEYMEYLAAGLDKAGLPE